ncbi:MAG: response regulator [Calditrichaceae bacterium]|nr:response regulator [Calditrichaceae bacterium]MBN2709011.1 response regulator [Calditrichaceae bacterium]RQV95337.1 MAG: response regulator [Calditrichota bacterium]
MTNKKHKKNFRSLSVTFAIGFSSLIIAALLIASGLQMYISFHAQQKVLSLNQQLIAKNAANIVENFIGEKISMMKTIAGRSHLTNMQTNEQKLYLEKLLGLEPIFRQLVLFNAKEERLVRTSRISNILAEKSMEYDARDLFYHISRLQIYISAVYIDKITSEPMVIMAVPVTDVFGDFKGALVAESNLKFMWELMDQIKIGKNGLAYLVDEQGYLIAYRDIGRVLKRENLKHLEEVSLIVNSHDYEHEPRFIATKGILDTRVLTTHVHLKMPRWAIVVELPVREAYESIIITLILSGLVLFISIISAILFGIYLSKRLTKPIIELRDATEKIGHGQFYSKINISSENEIGELAASFNKMVEDLNHTTVSRDALVKEINERKHAENTLRESEQKMRAILMASPIGICLISDNKLDWANDTLYRMTGYDENDLIGIDISVLFPDIKEYERVKRNLFLEFAGPRIGHVETKWIRKNSTGFDCILGSCSLDTKDASKGHIITINDISESKQLQSKLVHAQKMEAIGILAAGVAHDLNNILVGLVGYPELLLMDMNLDNKLRKPLETIKNSGEKAATIVQDLLTLARRGVTVNEIISLNDIIAEYLKSPEFNHLRSHHSNVTIKTKLDKNLLNISGSPFHLSKAIMNLVSNAAESMPEGGVVSLSTANKYLDQPLKGYEIIEEGEYVALTVSDNGIGISKENMKKIFEPFYTKKKMGRSGTGLGMAVIWSTVKDHKGFIDVQSVEGEGTKFTLYFPLCRQERSEEKISTSLDDLKARGESILVVDDVEEQRTIVSYMLTKLGYKVKTVSSGEEAVKYMKKSSADLMVLDMIMDPGINGLETYKKIIKIHPGQKAVITSGFSESEHVKEAQKLGAGLYVRKPYSMEILGRAVRMQLDNHK